VTSSTVEGRVVEGEVVAHQGVDLGIDTLPTGFPELTLGGASSSTREVLRAAERSSRRAQLWTPTLDQARFLLWWYAVDETGKWLFNHGRAVWRRGQASPRSRRYWRLRSSSVPVRVADIDPSVKGGVIGSPVDMPLVQIAATAESQTANTMRHGSGDGAEAVAAGCRVRDRRRQDDFLHTRRRPAARSSPRASAAEGAEVTFAVMDETEHWTPTSGGQDLAQTLDRNLAKSGSRAMETANAWEPDIGSVAETTFNAFQAQQSGRTRGRRSDAVRLGVAPATSTCAARTTSRPRCSSSTPTASGWTSTSSRTVCTTYAPRRTCRGGST
jgi:hypothetical protein